MGGEGEGGKEGDGLSGAGGGGGGQNGGGGGILGGGGISGEGESGGSDGGGGVGSGGGGGGANGGIGGAGSNKAIISKPHANAEPPTTPREIPSSAQQMIEPDRRLTQPQHPSIGSHFNVPEPTCSASGLLVSEPERLPRDPSGKIGTRAPER